MPKLDLTKAEKFHNLSNPYAYLDENSKSSKASRHSTTQNQTADLSQATTIINESQVLSIKTKSSESSIEKLKPVQNSLVKSVAAPSHIKVEIEVK